MINKITQGDLIITFSVGLVLLIGGYSWRSSAIIIAVILGLYKLLDYIRIWEIKKSKESGGEPK